MGELSIEPGFDPDGVVAAIAGDRGGARIRQGVVVSHEVGGTMTVLLGGDTTTPVANVRYLGTPVMPGNPVFLAVDKAGDMLGLGAANGRNSAPVARVYRDTNQSVANATDTAITWTTVDRDPWGMWNSSTDLIIPVDGYWAFTTSLIWAGNTGGYRQAGIKHVGWFLHSVDQRLPVGGSPARVTLTAQPLPMVKGAAVQVRVYQTSSVALNILGSWNGVDVQFGAHWLGPWNTYQ